MAKILFVDDDSDLIQNLHAFFSNLDQVIDTCNSGEDALQLLKSSRYDIIVLDWSMPGGLTGEQVCRQFRREGGQTPIIFLTGKSDIDSIEAGLDAGADDYVVKPFDIRELNARIKSNVKRKSATTIASLTIKGLSLDLENKTVSAAGGSIKLRAKELALLEFLIKHPDRIYSAQQILDGVWPADGEGTTDTVRTWINLLRKKLTSIGKGDLIRTVLGSGYTIDS
ncbi:MAG: response regulator transcription factor [Cyanobacteria bacterium REEB67]|nr:response regulator transcription factor [Cyanobacteria bacterium REEB67]